VRSAQWAAGVMWPVLTTWSASLLIWNVSCKRELKRRAPEAGAGPEVDAPCHAGPAGSSSWRERPAGGRGAPLCRRGWRRASSKQRSVPSATGRTHSSGSCERRAAVEGGTFEVNARPRVGQGWCPRPGLDEVTPSR